MRIKRQPEDFRVEEQIQLPGEGGPYAYYRVEKRGVSTTAVRDALAARLKVNPSGLVFPALKDAGAVAVQYASVRKRGPERVEGKGYVAQRVGWGSRALQPRDLRGNRFVLTVRELTEAQARDLGPVLAKIEACGLPNYFDEQRFGSLTPDGLVGKAILRRDAEKVVHMYLAEPMLGDPEEIRVFKALAESHWGQWGFLLHQAPRPSNLRSVITYLKDHPHDYAKAANLIQDRLLSIYLSAYQSWVWNRIVGRAFELEGPTPYTLEIVGTLFPMPELTEALLAKQDVLVDLPRLTARYEGPYEQAALEVFEAEGLELRDFKARILRRVYLSKGERPVWFTPRDVRVGSVEPDAYRPDTYQVGISFVLDPGRYATLVVKAAAALLGADLRAR